MKLDRRMVFLHKFEESQTVWKHLKLLTTHDPNPRTNSYTSLLVLYDSYVIQFPDAVMCSKLCFDLWYKSIDRERPVQTP
jgi:hypothetical protein